MSFTHAPKPLKSSRTKFVPKPYQTEAVKFGLSRPSAGFFLAPGLGKTIITLMIFLILRKLGVVKQLLVVTKRRIVYNVWPNEIKKWDKTENLTYSIVHGPRKLQALNEDSDIKLINFEGLGWLVQQKQWLRRHDKLMFVCDESSGLRSTRTVRFRKLRKLLPRFARRYILTGSPAPNGLMGLFGQVFTLDLGKTFGKYITAFRNDYFYPSGFMGYEWQLQKDAERRMFKKLRPLILRYGQDQLKLPPLTFIDRFVELPMEAREQYKKMEKQFVLEYENGDVVAANAAVASGKLRQIANGAAYYSDKHSDKKWQPIHEEKLESLVDLLEELQGEPALVAYEFNSDRDRITEYLKSYAPEVFKKSAFISRGMKDSEVAKIIKGWEKGKYVALFGQVHNIAHGLNLQGKGGIVVFFTMTWNLEDYEQFYQRVWRQGQKRRVLVYRIIARRTVDEVVAAALKTKDHNQQTLLKAMEKHYGIRQKSGIGRRVRSFYQEALRKEGRKVRRVKGQWVRAEHSKGAERLRAAG